MKTIDGMTKDEKLALLKLPLDEKIKRTKELILEWYLQYDGQVFVSFSGGKDSTVLLHIARSIKTCADIPAVLYARFAFSITISALSLNRVSIPPRFCSRLATESSDAFDVAANDAIIPAVNPLITASPLFAILPILWIPEENPLESIFVLNFK